MILQEELKMKKFASEYHRANLNIIFTGFWISDQFNAVLKQFGISEQQFNVLRILRGQNRKAVNLLSVQERMIQKMSNATRLVEKLKKKGYVCREICEENRRQVDISITDKGLKLLEELDTKVKLHEAKIFKNINEKEAKTIADLLDKLRG